MGRCSQYVSLPDSSARRLHELCHVRCQKLVESRLAILRIGEVAEHDDLCIEASGPGPRFPARRDFSQQISEISARPLSP